MARVFRQRVTPRRVLLVASEAGLILSAMAFSAWLHVGERAFTPVQIGKALLMAAVCQICLYCAELYDFKILSDRKELIIRLLQSIGSASLVLAVVYF